VGLLDRPTEGTVVLDGRDRTVALRSEKTVEGDDRYPVTVDLDWAPPELRAGMTVCVHFPEP
jgi:hypothetical protein